ncbi:MAG: hypothetical protein K6G65_03610 [Lachnospiraceae bacterium]|nr:hypothetical protein [Lachnospiraceae bacterium]
MKKTVIKIVVALCIVVVLCGSYLFYSTRRPHIERSDVTSIDILIFNTSRTVTNAEDIDKIVHMINDFPGKRYLFESHNDGFSYTIDIYHKDGSFEECLLADGIHIAGERYELSKENDEELTNYLATFFE